MPWLDKNHEPDTYGGFPFGNTRDSSMLQSKLWCFPNIWIFWYTKLYCDTFYEKKRTAVVCLVPRKDANILHPYCIMWWKETLTQPRFLMNTIDKNTLFGNLFLLQEHLQCILCNQQGYYTIPVYELLSQFSRTLNFKFLQSSIV